jgi:hypothetical protein
MERPGSVKAVQLGHSLAFGEGLGQIDFVSDNRILILVDNVLSCLDELSTIIT